MFTLPDYNRMSHFQPMFDATMKTAMGAWIIIDRRCFFTCSIPSLTHVLLNFARIKIHDLSSATLHTPYS